MKNMNDLMRQARIMQDKISGLQQELAAKTEEVSSGGGMVKVVMNGRQELRSLTIDPKVLADGDVEMLQDLIVSAVNEGVRVTRASLER